MDLDAAGGITRKLQDAVEKDTVTIPDGGFTIVRFTADNPGEGAHARSRRRSTSELIKGMGRSMGR